MSAWDNVSLAGPPQAPSYAAPLLDFSPIGNLARDYFQGTQDKRTLDLQSAFKGGLPMKPDGSVDYMAVAQTLAKKGDISQMIPLATAETQAKIPGQMAAATAAAFPGGPPPVAAPGAPPTAAPPAGAPAYRGGDASGSVMGLISARGYPDQAAGNVLKYLANQPAMRGIDPNQPLTPEQTALVNGVLDRLPTPAGASAPPPAPTGPVPLPRPAPRPQIDVPAPGVPAAPAPALAQAAAAGPPPLPQNWPGGAPAAPPAAPPAPRVTIPPTGIPKVEEPPATRSAAPAPGDTMPKELRAIVPRQFSDPMQYVNSLRRLQAQFEVYGTQGIKGADGTAKAFGAQADKVMDAVAKHYELTPEQKNAAASGGLNPMQYSAGVKNLELTPAQKEAGVGTVIPAAPAAGAQGEPPKTFAQATADIARTKAIGEKVGAEQGQAIGEYIAQGRSAQKRIEALDVMEDALTRTGNIYTGPGAEKVLKARQALSNIPGISSIFQSLDQNAISKAEAVQKIGFTLATQSVKEISGRPTQIEFVKALENNPGLLMTKAGSFAMINILRQSAEHDKELAKLAQRPDNHANWQDVADRFYASHPIKSPFDPSRAADPRDIEIMRKINGGLPLVRTAKEYNALDSGTKFIGADGQEWTR